MSNNYAHNHAGALNLVKLSGVGAPPATLIPDPTKELPFYVDTVTGDLYCYYGSAWSAPIGGGGATVGTGAPTGAGTAGDLYCDSASGQLYVYDGSAWATKGSTVTVAAGAPTGAGATGELYCDSATDTLYLYNGSAWVAKGGSSIDSYADDTAASAGGLVAGDIYFDTTKEVLKYFDGTGYIILDKNVCVVPASGTLAVGNPVFINASGQAELEDIVNFATDDQKVSDYIVTAVVGTDVCIQREGFAKVTTGLPVGSKVFSDNAVVGGVTVTRPNLIGQVDNYLYEVVAADKISIADQRAVVLSPPMVEYYRASIHNTNDQTITNGAFTEVVFDVTEYENIAGNVNLANNEIVVPNSGIYDVSFITTYTNLPRAVGVYVASRVMVNGVERARSMVNGLPSSASGGQPHGVIGNSHLELQAGDKITIEAYVLGAPSPRLFGYAFYNRLQVIQNQ